MDPERELAIDVVSMLDRATLIAIVGIRRGSRIQLKLAGEILESIQRELEALSEEADRAR